MLFAIYIFFPAHICMPGVIYHQTAQSSTEMNLLRFGVASFISQLS